MPSHVCEQYLYYSFTITTYLYYVHCTNAASYPPPEAISLALVNFGLKEITFTWDPVASDCPGIHYNILASNCGSCPTTTSHTNFTCTDVPTNGSTCTFAVQTVVCGNMAGDLSKPLTFNITETLKRYDIVFCASLILNIINATRR